MTHVEWQIVGFSAGMAVFSTLLIVPPGVALAWCLARLQWRGKVLIETVAMLPLVLPPVLTGLILLKVFGRNGPIGHWLHTQFDLDIIFTWRAVVVALSVMSFPFLVRTARIAIEGVDPALEQMARTLGAGEWRVFFTVTLPLARRGLIAGALLAFARALGEFGATITVAGNIVGKTTTLSVAIYNYVQLGKDAHVWPLALVSLGLAFVALLVSELMQRGRK